MAPVCPVCNSLFAGGDGRTCPSCGAALAPEGTSPSTAGSVPRGRAADRSPPVGAADGRVAEGDRVHGATRRRAADAPGGARIGLLLAAVVLVPISSFVGVRGWAWGWLWIWQPSLLADVVFTLGTMGAFLASVRLGHAIGPTATAVVASMGAGFFLHWVVYEISWSLVVATGLDDVSGLASLGFVAWVGGFGLFASAAAGGAATWILRRSSPADQRAEPAPTPVR